MGFLLKIELHLVRRILSRNAVCVLLQAARCQNKLFYGWECGAPFLVCLSTGASRRGDTKSVLLCSSLPDKRMLSDHWGSYITLAFLAAGFFQHVSYCRKYSKSDILWISTSSKLHHLLNSLTPVALPAAANSSHYCGWRQREGLGMTSKQSRSRRYCIMFRPLMIEIQWDMREGWIHSRLPHFQTEDMLRQGNDACRHVELWYGTKVWDSGFGQSEAKWIQFIRYWLMCREWFLVVDSSPRFRHTSRNF